MSTIDDTQLQHIINIKEASEQWKTLKQIHETLSQQRLSLLQLQFYSLEAGGKTIDKAVSYLNGIQGDIKIINEKEAPMDTSKKVILLKNSETTTT